MLLQDLLTVDPPKPAPDTTRKKDTMSQHPLFVTELKESLSQATPPTVGTAEHPLGPPAASPAGPHPSEPSTDAAAISAPAKAPRQAVDAATRSEDRLGKLVTETDVAAADQLSGSGAEGGGCPHGGAAEAAGGGDDKSTAHRRRRFRPQDLVWAKVRGWSWFPSQIFRATDFKRDEEKFVKIRQEEQRLREEQRSVKSRHQRGGRRGRALPAGAEGSTLHLVLFFGDATWGWIEEQHLRPMSSAPRKDAMYPSGWSRARANGYGSLFKRALLEAEAAAHAHQEAEAGGMQEQPDSGRARDMTAQLLAQQDPLDLEPLAVAFRRRQQALELFGGTERHGLTPAWVTGLVVNVFDLEVIGLEPYMTPTAEEPEPTANEDPSGGQLNISEAGSMAAGPTSVGSPAAEVMGHGASNDISSTAPEIPGHQHTGRPVTTPPIGPGLAPHEPALPSAGDQTGGSALGQAMCHEAPSPAAAADEGDIEPATPCKNDDSFPLELSPSQPDAQVLGPGDTSSSVPDASPPEAQPGDGTVEMQLQSSAHQSPGSSVVLPSHQPPVDVSLKRTTRGRCGNCRTCLDRLLNEPCLDTEVRRLADARPAPPSTLQYRRLATRCGHCLFCKRPTLRQRCLNYVEEPWLPTRAGSQPLAPGSASALQHLREEASRWSFSEYRARPPSDVRILGLLDPASNSHGRPNVPAEKVYTAEEDGLSVGNSWEGHFIFLNPPFESALQWRFINRIIDEVESGRCRGAILLCRGSPDTNWWPRLRPYPRVLCRRNTVQFLDYCKTPIAFGVAIFCLYPPGPKQLHVYQTFCEKVKTKGEVSIPIDRYFLFSSSFTQLLARLQEQAAETFREHWLQCDTCSQWRRVPFDMYATAVAATAATGDAHSKLDGGQSSSALKKKRSRGKQHTGSRAWTCSRLHPDGCGSVLVEADSKWQYGRLMSHSKKARLPDPATGATTPTAEKAPAPQCHPMQPEP